MARLQSATRTIDAGADDNTAHHLLWSLAELAKPTSVGAKMLLFATCLH